MKRQDVLKYFVICSLLVTSFSSCTADDEVNKEALLKSYNIEDDTVNGENPFLIANMETAWENLKNNPTANIDQLFENNNLSISDFEIYTSDAQYKFIPSDSIQYKSLWEDPKADPSETLLTHLDENLDLEATGEDIDVEDQNDNFEDGQPFSQPTVYPLYAIISPSHSLLNQIDNIKIDDYYFPAEDESEESRTNAENILFSTEFFDMLENEAFKLTGNFDEEELQALRFLDPEYPVQELVSIDIFEVRNRNLNVSDLLIDYTVSEQKLFRRRSPWTPKGTLKFQETDVVGQPEVGVAGARIRVRKWGLKVIRKAHTNVDGYFQTSSTRTKRVKYAVYFKNNNHRFVIKAGTAFWNARYRSTRKHKRKDWNPALFTAGTKRHFYAQVQYAAFDYYNRVSPTYNIPVPNIISELKISAKYNRDVSSRFRVFAPAFFNDLRISRIRSGQPRGTVGVYATTIHEMTHAAHYREDSGIFHPLILFDGKVKERDLMRESWAEGVETFATNTRYITLDPTFFNINTISGRNSDKQLRSFSQQNEYTAIVYDMIDNANQFDISEDRANDMVRNYQLSQMWQSLDGRRSLDTWRNNLIDDHINPTEIELNALFTYYQRVADAL
ncbi:hypothetical protein [Nonlabens ulvanivorans]|uniref:hypothetical protein n=1 Tax=Nonlabens ulvanivorans TaxID=906888 RepID=UPI0011B1FA04|nr:hypothetical protein [Nonlabens ulvanivorans]